MLHTTRRLNVMVTESSVTELATYRVCKEAAAGDKAAGEDDGEDEGGGAPEDLGAKDERVIIII